MCYNFQEAYNLRFKSTVCKKRRIVGSTDFVDLSLAFRRHRLFILCSRCRFNRKSKILIPTHSVSIFYILEHYYTLSNINELNASKLDKNDFVTWHDHIFRSARDSPLNRKRFKTWTLQDSIKLILATMLNSNLERATIARVVSNRRLTDVCGEPILWNISFSSRVTQ